MTSVKTHFKSTRLFITIKDTWSRSKWGCRVLESPRINLPIPYVDSVLWKHLSWAVWVSSLAAVLQQAEESGRFVWALTGSSAYYSGEKGCTPASFSDHLLRKCITPVWSFSCHWLISQAVLNGKQHPENGAGWADSQASFLLLVTNLARRATWEMPKYCGSLGLMKSVIFSHTWHFWKASVKFLVANRQICDDVEKTPFHILTEWRDLHLLPFLNAQNKRRICREGNKYKMQKVKRFLNLTSQEFIFIF